MYKWKFCQKMKMVMVPKTVFDMNKLTDAERQKDIDYKKWQPECVWILFQSDNSCDFTLTAHFTDEEAAVERRAALKLGGSMEQRLTNRLLKPVHERIDKLSENCDPREGLQVMRQETEEFNR